MDHYENERRERRTIYYSFKFLHIEMVHSMPSNSGGRKSASGRRLAIIAALPRIRWRDIFWISWPIISLSSEPVCLASAEPRRFSWLTARWCMPPSVSRAMGRKTSPCCRQASAVEHKTFALVINRDYFSTVFSTSDDPCTVQFVYS